MRQIILDTETTGLDPAEGHRVIEIAAIALENLMPTGQAFHRIIDPERDVPADASRIHGFTNGDLQGKPRFADIAAKFVDFLGDDTIIAHNAAFDFGFLDAELTRCGLPPLDRARMVDTLALARERFPGMPNSLDALCRRYEIDISMRTTHNALLDVRLLAQVFLELKGGRQPGLLLASAEPPPLAAIGSEGRARHTARPIEVPDDRLQAHAEFVAEKVKDALWLKSPFAASPER